MTSLTPAPNAPVLVIDLQTVMFDGVLCPPLPDAEGLIARVEAILAWARREGRKVGFVRHDGAPGEPMAPGAPAWELWPAIARAEGEPIFQKSEGDAFSQPALSAWLAGLGADEVILTGAQSDFCVAATTRGALGRDLRVTVVEDAHGTWASAEETADQIIARHNALFAALGARLIKTETLIAG